MNLLKKIDYSTYNIGLKRDGSVRLKDYDEKWGRAFEFERDILNKALSNLEFELFHIGSKSIKGCIAKPIIDILGSFEDISLLDENKKSIIEAGYVYKGEYGISGRRYCVKYNDDETEGFFHLHLFEKGNSEIKKHLLFRDYLRTYTDKMSEYCELKKQLKRKFENQRSRYTAAKDGFIKNIIEMAIKEKNGK